jgi:predicted nucleotidyltransferase
MRVQDVLAQVRPRLQEVFGARLHNVVLYGSEARGEAMPDSDIDLMVLLAGPISLMRDIETIVHALYPLQLEIDRPIHAIPVKQESFDAGDYRLYRAVKAEGVFL